ncbi:MAG: bifunctional histidinol-phosphatase/imidazoleglycerol-phosphate dehydratase HisB [Salinivirgaceae bacterium]|jgi:imidazoleglycerol-phosphate dehydratase/histidinol-phosphatase|nr:bifunctional histidinol-phosphatase/imidazoleglycerol-phosphate dehydratase HisB [Salinivirgaceae bacterium]
MAKKKILFIDRDGTIIKEPPIDFQIDSLQKLEFLPKVLRNLYQIRKNSDYLFVMVSNQDGLGTDSFPTPTFVEPHEKMNQILANEGIVFDAEHIDPSLPEENSPNRKPGIGMLTGYFNSQYDMENSLVIGDRYTDVELAKNMGCKAIWINDKNNKDLEERNLSEYCAFTSTDWDEIKDFILQANPSYSIERNTKETKISLTLHRDNINKTNIKSGLNFFDHMLEQLARHSGCGLELSVKGDLEVDEHHTIEDVAIALGEAYNQLLGDKRGINRYGFLLPMDEALATAAIDFSGRPWFIWDVEFSREYVGDFPLEMAKHFFKSFSDSAKCNLHIKVEGENDHHKLEGIFKAVARAIKDAMTRNANHELPSTKGML